VEQVPTQTYLGLHGGAGQDSSGVFCFWITRVLQSVFQSFRATILTPNRQNAGTCIVPMRIPIDVLILGPALLLTWRRRRGVVLGRSTPGLVGRHFDLGAEKTKHLLLVPGPIHIPLTATRPKNHTSHSTFPWTTRRTPRLARFHGWAASGKGYT
jgi:hypothetical protein